MKKMKNIVKELDGFGMPIVLNFDGNKQLHKTFLGGIISLILYIFYIYYIITLISKLINHG